MLRGDATASEPGNATVFKDERKQAYLNPEGTNRPLISPIPAATLDTARKYPLGRLRAKMKDWDCSALLLYDPVNIRYALDSSNMSIWTMHNPSRYALIHADGPAIMFEFEGAEHVNTRHPGIDEVRTAKSFLFFTAGNLAEHRMRDWADELASIIKSHGGNGRAAVDRLDPAPAAELRERGFRLLDGQELAEQARSIKSPEEIELMRWTIRVCEAGMARMYEVSEPGRTEREIWAELHSRIRVAVAHRGKHGSERRKPHSRGRVRKHQARDRGSRHHEWSKTPRHLPLGRTLTPFSDERV
ncbi:hypothetical protein J2W42_005977 [Rhizobium tibeticum]|nr:hypothetical protein [Rhizobium tibeticum]MDP9813106.1 hypothetical protein [Rhizobium tibeticum]